MSNADDVIGSQPLIDLDAPVTTYRISVDVDMQPVGMSTQQALGLFIAALESADSVVRDVRINQCSTLSSDGMRHCRDISRLDIAGSAPPG
jgi:hypothetical protein